MNRLFLEVTNRSIDKSGVAVISNSVTYEKNLISFFEKLSFSFNKKGFHGVMVSTQDSESCDPSSNLGGT